MMLTMVSIINVKYSNCILFLFIVLLSVFLINIPLAKKKKLHWLTLKLELSLMSLLISMNYLCFHKVFPVKNFASLNSTSFKKS